MHQACLQPMQAALAIMLQRQTKTAHGAARRSELHEFAIQNRCAGCVASADVQRVTRRQWALPRAPGDAGRMAVCTDLVLGHRSPHQHRMADAAIALCLPARVVPHRGAPADRDSADLRRAWTVGGGWVRLSRSLKPREEGMFVPMQDGVTAWLAGAPRCEPHMPVHHSRSSSTRRDPVPPSWRRR